MMRTPSNSTNPLITWSRRRWWVMALLVASLVFGTMAVAKGPHLTGFMTDDSCWGGVLFQDPLQCYALEEAQREGLIDVEAVYLDQNYVDMYITQPRLPQLDDYFKDKGREFIESWPDRVSYSLSDHGCYDLAGGAGYEDCILDWTFWLGGTISPWDSPFLRIRLEPGGADSRFGKGGWASWRQLWPRATQGRTASRSSSRDKGSFDISGVDVTNFPAGCQFHIMLTSCLRYHEFPNLGITLWPGHIKTYVHVKAVPDDHVSIELARETLIDAYGFGDGERLVIVPVEYDYEELKRWALILKRFSVSPGNTIGLLGADVASTAPGYPQGTIYLNGLEKAPLGDEELRYTNVRMTILVWTYDPSEFVEIMPDLLAQLGIPKDAVGIVGQDFQSSSALSVGILEGNSMPAKLARAGAGAAEDLGSAANLPVWVIYLGGSAGVVVIGLILLFMARRLRGHRMSSLAGAGGETGLVANRPHTGSIDLTYTNNRDAELETTNFYRVTSVNLAPVGRRSELVRIQTKLGARGRCPIA